jgi:hypothetical protein
MDQVTYRGVLALFYHHVENEIFPIPKEILNALNRLWVGATQEDKQVVMEAHRLHVMRRDIPPEFVRDYIICLYLGPGINTMYYMDGTIKSWEV